MTPLHLAAEQGCASTAQFLVEKGADINIKDNYGVCVLHVLITSTMGNFAAWFAGRLTCDSNKVSNSQDFED